MELYNFDEGFLSSDEFVLCGVDEAGRGPLCGPVCVAAVVLDGKSQIEGLHDSKKLSEKKRESLYEIIIQSAKAYCVVLVHPHEIDRMNILNATLKGMKDAVEGLPIAPDLVLVDGNKAPDVAPKCQTVVKGDATSACIAAASILAKVTRDRYMKELDEQYPQYKLAQHKGYGTKLHYELLHEHGVQDFYRQTFLKSFYSGKHAK